MEAILWRLAYRQFSIVHQGRAGLLQARPPSPIIPLRGTDRIGWLDILAHLRS